MAKTEVNQKYVLTLDEEQANVLSMACELLSRIHMGQLKSVADCFMAMDCCRWTEIRDKLEEIEPLITGRKNCFFGIHSKEIPNRARIAWDLYQVLRHRVSHDRADREGIPNDFSHRMTVNYDEPMVSSGKPLSEMKKAEG